MINLTRGIEHSRSRSQDLRCCGATRLRCSPIQRAGLLGEMDVKFVEVCETLIAMSTCEGLSLSNESRLDVSLLLMIS